MKVTNLTLGGALPTRCVALSLATNVPQREVPALKPKPCHLSLRRMPGRGSAAAVILWAALVGAIPSAWAQTGLPVFQVVQSGATAAQAQSLASTLRIPVQSLSLSNGEALFLDPSNFMAVPAVQVTDAIHAAMADGFEPVTAPPLAAKIAPPEPEKPAETGLAE